MSVLLAFSLLVLVEAGSQKAPGTDAMEQVADPQDKIICKRFIETGSLVKGYRVCKSKRDWVRERDEIRQTPPSAASCANLNPNSPC